MLVKILWNFLMQILPAFAMDGEGINELSQGIGQGQSIMRGGGGDELMVFAAQGRQLLRRKRQRSLALDRASACRRPN